MLIYSCCEQNCGELNSCYFVSFMFLIFLLKKGYLYVYAFLQQFCVAHQEFLWHSSNSFNFTLWHHIHSISSIIKDKSNNIPYGKAAMWNWRAAACHPLVCLHHRCAEVSQPVHDSCQRRIPASKSFCGEVTGSTSLWEGLKRRSTIWKWQVKNHLFTRARDVRWLL